VFLVWTLKHETGWKVHSFEKISTVPFCHTCSNKDLGVGVIRARFLVGLARGGHTSR